MSNKRIAPITVTKITTVTTTIETIIDDGITAPVTTVTKKVVTRTQKKAPVQKKVPVQKNPTVQKKVVQKNPTNQKKVIDIQQEEIALGTKYALYCKIVDLLRVEIFRHLQQKLSKSDKRYIKAVELVDTYEKRALTLNQLSIDNGYGPINPNRFNVGLTNVDFLLM